MNEFELSLYIQKIVEDYAPPYERLLPVPRYYETQLEKPIVQLSLRSNLSSNESDKRHYGLSLNNFLISINSALSMLFAIHEFLKHETYETFSSKKNIDRNASMQIFSLIIMRYFSEMRNFFSNMHIIFENIIEILPDNIISKKKKKEGIPGLLSSLRGNKKINLFGGKDEELGMLNCCANYIKHNGSVRMHSEKYISKVMPTIYMRLDIKSTRQELIERFEQVFLKSCSREGDHLQAFLECDRIVQLFSWFYERALPKILDGTLLSPLAKRRRGCLA